MCFYSNRCNWSKAFLTELAASPFKSQFKYVCVDASPTRPKLPSFLKEVPTILVAGDPEPKVSSEAFNWLSLEKVKVTGKQQTSSIGPDANEPAGYNMTENMSFAKGIGYSFNDSETNTEGSGGALLPGTFEFLGGAPGAGVRNANDFPGGGAASQGRSRSKKEELFDKQMEQYQRDRNQGVPNKQGRI
jgi:hypothetical protein